MRVLVVYCHPVETSFASALHQEVLESKGSAENVMRMRFAPGVKLARVQSDV